MRVMKKMMMFAALGIATIGVAVAATIYHLRDDQPIGYSELPAKAQKFVEKYYAGVDVTHITMDRDVTSTEYDVVLGNGTKIEFNADGEWREVDAHRSAVPSDIVPKQIRSYVDKNYKGDDIVELKRERNGWDVKLSRGLELEFDTAFRLTEVDD